MTDLIRMNLNGKFPVNARDLWKFLESKREFTNWVIDNIRRYNFIKDIDYSFSLKNLKRSVGGASLHEYNFTKDNAKIIIDSCKKKMPSIEKQYIDILYMAFKDCMPIKQYWINKYKIDLFLKEYNICIECDEFEHKYYDEKKEQKRFKYLEKNYILIKFDPCVEYFNIGEIIYNIRKKINLIQIKDKKVSIPEDKKLQQIGLFE